MNELESKMHSNWDLHHEISNATYIGDWVVIREAESVLENSTNSYCSPWSKDIAFVISLDCLVFMIAVALNIIGAKILLKNGIRKITNQKLFLVHLSFVTLLSLATNIFAIFLKASCIKFPRSFIICFYIVYIAYIGNLIILTGDRALFVWLVLRYKSVCTKTNAYKSIIASWVIAICYGVILQMCGLLTIPKYVKYASFVYNGFTVLFTIVVYIFIALKVASSSKRVHVRRSSLAVERKKYKKHILPLYIALTFILFSIVPPLIVNEVEYDKEDTQIVVLGMIGVNMLNSISDPVTYILLSSK